MLLQKKHRIRQLPGQILQMISLGVNELSGKVDGYSRLLTALKETCPVPIGFEQIGSGAKGYYHTAEHRIALQEGMSEMQTVKTLIHEMAHQKLHSHEKEKPREERLTARSKEVEAESVAYTVCQHFGIDTSDCSFGYIAGWSSGKETAGLYVFRKPRISAGLHLNISLNFR